MTRALLALAAFRLGARLAQHSDLLRSRGRLAAHAAMGRPLIHGADFQDSAIRVDGASRLRISDCTFTHTAPLPRPKRSLSRIARGRRRSA